MKKIVLIFLLVLSLCSCVGQVPGIGGVMTAGESGPSVISELIFYLPEIHRDALYFDQSGVRMFTGDNNGDITSFTLSTPWDVSTAVYDNKSINVESIESYMRSIQFNTDGTRMYIVGTTTDRIQEFTLSTPWDILTALHTQTGPYMYDGFPFEIQFNSSGTKVYLLGYSGRKIYQWSLTTPWDVSTLANDNIYYDYSGISVSAYIRGFTISDDGYWIFLTSYTYNKAFKIPLSTPWDITTAGTVVESFDDYTSYDIKIHNDILYILNAQNHKINQNYITTIFP